MKMKWVEVEEELSTARLQHKKNNESKSKKQDMNPQKKKMA